jgi:hypothetical protein
MNVILKKVPKWGSNFFFTFPTSEGSDLLSSHVMQTPTFISKLSDGNVIFRLDVGKKHLLIVYAYDRKFVKTFIALVLSPTKAESNRTESNRKN